MTRRAPRVCTTQADVERVVALIAALPAHGHVVLWLRDGSSRTGVVSVRASVQVFRDPEGLEGMNAEITLECRDAPGGDWRLWLDQVERVEHLDSALASEN
ncbi:MAG: DUF3247 family protein [Dokdonella sp.]